MYQDVMPANQFSVSIWSRHLCVC